MKEKFTSKEVKLLNKNFKELLELFKKATRGKFRFAEEEEKFHQLRIKILKIPKIEKMWNAYEQKTRFDIYDDCDRALEFGAWIEQKIQKINKEHEILAKRNLDKIKKEFKLDFIKYPDESIKKAYKNAIAYGFKLGNENRESWIDPSKTFSLIITSDGDHKKINNYKDPNKNFLISSEKTKINEILKTNTNDLAIESKIFKIEKLKASIEDTKKELKTLLKNDYENLKESKLQK